MKLYSYNGPVYEFNRLVCDKWKGKTQANTEQKAKANLMYRYKKEVGYLPTAKIKMPGKLEIIEV